MPTKKELEAKIVELKEIMKGLEGSSVKQIYIVSKRETWADHRRSDGSTSVVAMTEDAFTAYAHALEVWLEEYIERVVDYEEEVDTELMSQVEAKISSSNVSDLEALHALFSSYASRNWRNEYGGDISVSVQIEAKSLSKKKNVVLLF